MTTAPDNLDLGDGWRIVGFTTDGQAYDEFGDPIDYGREPRALHPDFIEPDPLPEIETVDPGKYL